jgi:flagellar motor protein MotB
MTEAIHKPRKAADRTPSRSLRTLTIVSLTAGLLSGCAISDYFGGDEEASDETVATAEATEEADAVPGADKPFPQAVSVPGTSPRPPLTAEQRAALADGLIADRVNAKYTDEQLRQESAVRPPSASGNAMAAKDGEPPPPQAAPRTPVRSEPLQSAAPPPALPTPPPSPPTAAKAPEPESQPKVANLPRSEAPAAAMAKEAPKAAAAPAAPTQPPPAPQPSAAPTPTPADSAQAAEAPRLTPPPAPAVPETLHRTRQTAALQPPPPAQIAEPGSPSGQPKAQAQPRPMPTQLAQAAGSSAVTVNTAVLESLGPTGNQPQPVATGAVPTGSGHVEQVGVILFPHGSARLSDRDRVLTDKIAELAQSNGGTVRVVGHSSGRTREVVTFQHQMINFEMSMKRAASVAQALVDAGVPPNRVVTEAKGSSEPIFQEWMPSGEAGNRRVEVFLEF